MVVGACGVPGIPGTVSGAAFLARAAALAGACALAAAAGLATAGVTWPNCAAAAATVTSSRRAPVTGAGRIARRRTVGRYVLLGFLIVPPDQWARGTGSEPENLICDRG